MTRLALTCLLSEGHLLLEDFPGTGKTQLAKALAATVQGTQQPHPVHARPAALRRHRRDDLRPEHREVRVPPGPDLRHHRARRRDQPGLAQDPVGAARGHGGGPGHRRRRAAQRRRAVHGHRDPEPDRAGRHLPAARGAARPLPHEDQRRLPRPRGHHADPRATPRSATGPGASSRSSPRGVIADMAELAARSTSTRRCWPTYAASPRRPRRHPSLKLGLSVRGCLAYVRCAKTWAASQGRTYVIPDDIKLLAEPVLSHRLLLDAEAEFAGTTVDAGHRADPRRRPATGPGQRAGPRSAPGAVCRPPSVCQPPPDPPAAEAARPGGAALAEGERDDEAAERTLHRTPNPAGPTPHASTRIPEPRFDRVADRSS